MLYTAIDNNTDQPTDFQLITRIQARETGWKALFGVLVARHQSALFGRCLAYLKQREDAADAVQETLFRAYRAIDGFNGDAAFRTWLFTIADNQCHSLVRRRARHVLDEHQQDAIRVHQQEPYVAPCDDTGVDDNRDCVMHAMQRLQQSGRDVLQLRYFADLSIEEIATTLGVGLSAAKMRLYRAQDQIARLLGDCVLRQAA